MLILSFLSIWINIIRCTECAVGADLLCIALWTNTNDIRSSKHIQICCVYVVRYENIWLSKTNIALQCLHLQVSAITGAEHNYEKNESKRAAERGKSSKMEEWKNAIFNQQFYLCHRSLYKHIAPFIWRTLCFSSKYIEKLRFSLSLSLSL